MQNKNQILLAGAALGAITGLIGAMLLIRRAESVEGDGTAHITTGDGMKLGVMIFGLLRSISLLGEDK
jgi:ABC-type Mn2+/Zn2+ transport system permease subunit